MYLRAYKNRRVIVTVKCSLVIVGIVYKETQKDNRMIDCNQQLYCKREMLGTDKMDSYFVNINQGRQKILEESVK